MNSYLVFDHHSGMWVHPDNELDPVEPCVYQTFEMAMAAKWALLAANDAKHADSIEIQIVED